LTRRFPPPNSPFVARGGRSERAWEPWPNASMARASLFEARRYGKTIRNEVQTRAKAISAKKRFTLPHPAIASPSPRPIRKAAGVSAPTASIYDPHRIRGVRVSLRKHSQFERRTFRESIINRVVFNKSRNRLALGEGLGRKGTPSRTMAQYWQLRL
jgi:hypothetical protein